MRLPLSICLIVRDEEQALPGCLASVAPFAAELIVVDTGSTDRTREIAAEFGARIADFTWCDDFSAARNSAASLASQPHIFALDADERLSADSLPALEAYCRSARVAVGRVVRTNLAEDGSTALTVESLSRLYPNRPGYRHHGRIHEQILHDGRPAPTVDTSVRLVHTGYAPATLVHGGKVDRNLRLLQLARDEEPANPYLAYQIGRTHQAAGHLREASTAYRAALHGLEGRPPAESPYLSSLLLQLGYALLGQHDVSGVLDILAQATELYADFTDLYFLYGLAVMELDQASHLADVRMAFEHCLTLGEPNPAQYESVAGVGSYRAAYNLGVYHDSVGEAGLARAYFERAAALNYPPAVERLSQMPDDRRRCSVPGQLVSRASRVHNSPDRGLTPVPTSADH
jgi:tetratricopeptide (TPR) repeat protein